MPGQEIAVDHGRDTQGAGLFDRTDLGGHFPGGVHQLRRADGAQGLGGAGRADPENLQQVLRPGRMHLRVIGARRCRALRIGFVEQPACAGNAHQRRDRYGAGGFAEQGDVIRIPAEGLDVLLNPFQGSHLVPQAHVRVEGPLRRRIRAEVHKPQGADAVVQGYVENITVPHDIGAAVGGFGGGTRAESAPVEINEHRTQRFRGLQRGRHVEREAVLVHGHPAAGPGQIGRLGLWRDRAEGRTVPDAAPAFGRLRCTQPQFPHRRGGIRNAPPGPHAVLDNSLHQPVAGLNHQ